MDLVGLLRWKAKKRQIPEVLTSLLKIDGEEIVKVNCLFMDEPSEKLMGVMKTETLTYQLCVQ